MSSLGLGAWSVKDYGVCHGDGGIQGDSPEPDGSVDGC